MILNLSNPLELEWVSAMAGKSKNLGLKDQLLLAALDQSGGDCQKTFTMEDLVVRSWQTDRYAWGLRGYEDQYPDADKIQKEIGSRGGDQKGMVDLGLLERVGRRMYRMTPAGLSAALSLNPADVVAQEKVDRELETTIRGIIDHPVFRKWLADPSFPKHFRDAGHFWRIAPGTPAKTIRERLGFLDRTLSTAKVILNDRGVNQIVAARGKVLFDRNDVDRCIQFHSLLKNRFSRDLKMLAPEINLNS